MPFLLKPWPFRAADSSHSFTMAADFLRRMWAEVASGSFFRNVKREKWGRGEAAGSCFQLGFPSERLLCSSGRSALADRVWRRVSTGSTGSWEWEAWSSQSSVVAADRCLHLIFDSTHPRFIHPGQLGRAGCSALPFLRTTNRLFLFSLCFEAPPDSFSISGKIPVRKFFTARVEPRSVSAAHAEPQRGPRLVFVENAQNTHTHTLGRLKLPV